MTAANHKNSNLPPFSKQSTKVPHKGKFSLPKDKKGRTEKKVEWKASFCGACIDPYCAVKVKVVDGVVAAVEGDTSSPVNKGQLCPRGLNMPMSLYNPYRIKTPLRRTNPNRSLDEDPGWVEISWEEALDTVAEKLKEARDTDPRSFIYMPGFGYSGTQLPFGQAFGTPNEFWAAGALCPEHFSALHLNGSFLDCLDLERCNYVVSIGRSYGADYAVASGTTTNFVRAIERGMRLVNVNPLNSRQGQVPGAEWVPIRPGTETAFGLALLHVIIHEVKKFDEWWVKIRSNGPYLIPDTQEYLKGSRVFMEDYIRDAETGKPLVWDTAAERPVAFDQARGDTYALTGTYIVKGQKVKPCFQVLKDYIVEFTPEWASPITTIPAQVIRNIAFNLVTEARIGSNIEIDGFTFPYRPACINIGRGGVTNRLGTQAYKALGMVNVLLGNSDVPGGNLGCMLACQHPLLQPDENGILKATESFTPQVTGDAFEFPLNCLNMKGMYLMRQNTTPLAWKALLEPDKYYITFPVKVVMVHATNVIACNANKENALKAFQKIPFVVSIAYSLDESTQVADIVLPEDHPLEETQIFRVSRWHKATSDANRGLMGTMIRTPVVKRLYNTRDVNNIFIELARRIGFLPQLYELTNKILTKNAFDSTMPRGLVGKFALDPKGNYTWEEIVERKIKQDYGEEAGFKDFAECAFKPYIVASAKETYNYYYAPENMIRQPIYYDRIPRIAKKLKQSLIKVGATVPKWDMEDFLRHYSGFPIWYQPPHTQINAEYPFRVINWKTHFMLLNTMSPIESPWVHEIIDKYIPDSKIVMMNRATAEPIKIREGDKVWVESEKGKTSGKIHLTNLIHPECIGIAGNFGRMGLGMNPVSWEGPQFNQLLSDDEATIEPLLGTLENSPRAKVYKVQASRKRQS